MHTFWHFSAHFHIYSELLGIYPPGLFLGLRGFTAVLVQRDQKRMKENKKKMAKPFCTLVVHICPPPI